MRFGVVLPLFSGWDAVLDAARRAEAAGYDEVWVSDHLVGIPDPGSPVLEAWTTLSGLAAATERIGIGSLVLSASFRPPRVLAKAAQTLFEIAGPRLTIGLGAGWHQEEHRAFAIEFAAAPERVARLEETVDAVRELAPDVPVLIGGAGARIRDLAVRKADWWNVPGDRLDDLPELVAGFEPAQRATGREVAIASRVGVLLAASAEEADARLARRSKLLTRVGLGPLGFVGDADEIVRRIGLHRELGVTRIAMGFPPADLERGALETFAADVLPRARG